MNRLFTRRPAGRGFAVLVTVLAIGLLVPTASYASGVTVNDLDNGATAAGLAQGLLGGGVSVSNVTYTGANRAAGTFTNGAGSIGFASGIVLDSGNVQTYTGTDPACSQGVEGPNNCYEGAADGESNSTSMGTPGDSGLDALLPMGQTSEDAAVLQFDFVPQQSTVQFSYVFSSDEYNDFANTGYNDIFAFFVNGTNCALVPGTTDPVSVNTINNGNPGGDTTAHHPELFRDNVRPNPSIDSQMDGLTTVLTCNANVNAGVTNHMKLAIADVGDSAYDSAVFIEAGSLVSGRTLTVHKAGTGTGKITSDVGGIDCGATCSHSYADGTMVTLTATADPGSTFAGWSGDCSGTGTCTVTMSAAKDATATFNLHPPHDLTVNKDGTGSGGVTSSPAGIDCGATCTHAYPEGGMVTLTPTPTFDSTFDHWTGCTSVTNDQCMVTMGTADKAVTATFTLLPTHDLAVTKAGSGTGTVSSSPAGIDCGATCSHAYPEGAVVTLTATPAAGSNFTGWSGDCTGTGTCMVTMDAAHAVTATFVLKRLLTVSKGGNGSGSVSSSPAGIDCGATCSASYNDGTVVTLTATPAAGSNFAGWSGDCTGTGTCTVTMSQARNVTATFTVQTHTLNVTLAGSGSGSVSSSPAGISCGPTCSASYDHGTGVTLTAAAASGSTFAGWSGDCTGTGTCVVTMTGDHNVTATFTANPPPIDVGGPGGVDTSGLFCGVQHRGHCNGLKVKGVFDRPGNAVWTFDAYNPNPGNQGVNAAAASKKIRLGQIKRVIKKAGTITVVFKLNKGAKTNKLYKQVKKAKLRNVLVTLTFTTPSGEKVTKTKVIKLKG